jgi:hypothetical protein
VAGLAVFSDLARVSRTVTTASANGPGSTTSGLVRSTPCSVVRIAEVAEACWSAVSAANGLPNVASATLFCVAAPNATKVEAV